MRVFFFCIQLALDHFEQSSLLRVLNPQRRRKRVHDGSENVKGKSPKAGHSGGSRAGGSQGKRRHVEAVTLFEVVTMGRSAMQVK